MVLETLVKGVSIEVITVLPVGSLSKVIAISVHGVIVMFDLIRELAISGIIHGERDVTLHITIDTVGNLIAHP